MLSYHEYEKVVFDWLIDKHHQDPNFTFTVRQTAGKGSEVDYFIGKSNSNYFGTTFWTLPVSFPGSSSDCINLIFQLSKAGYSYYFEFSQTQSPHDAQNKSALNLVQALRTPLEHSFELKRPVKEDNKIYNIQVAGRENRYDNLDLMLADIDDQLSGILELTDEAIVNEKSNNPNFKAHRVSQEEFENLITRLNKRIEKHQGMTEKITLDDSANDGNLQESMGSVMPLNQILYGPPGTGKTYNTINKALSIIEGKSESDFMNEDRSELKRRYQEYVDKGQIVFTTFHQSMSYEDFVEGIKPQTVNEKIVYEVEPGIFKNICNKARLTKGNFDEVLEKFKVDTEQGSREQALAIKSKATSFDVEFRGTNVFYVQPHNSSKDNPWYPVNIENIRKAFETGNYDKIYNPTYVREIISFLEREYKLKRDTGSQDDRYVLIIDEINRGNVSAIFGELITLIEESKRLGSDEALEVTLPYNKKEKFSVPGNLYIIGTMNTADRRVEALDTALRRRFSFQHMPPRPELISVSGALREFGGKILIDDVADIDLALVLSLINRRISVLLDADHQIGHSYFMQEKTTSDLASAFRNCIMPLLQEYFYHDEEKIAWVLGEGFVGVRSENTAEDIFPQLNFGRRPTVAKAQYFFKEVGSEDISLAISQLLG